MQARTVWTTPEGALGRLTTRARARAGELGSAREWAAKAAEQPVAPSFEAALRTGRVAVIAEVKRRSPSKGALDESMDAVSRALLYEGAGVRAISVLTEPTEFGGSPEDLRSIRAAVARPLLKKDFHVDPLHMFEARALGASAALLIMRALGPDDTRLMVDAAREAGVEALCEIRDEHELTWALDAGATMIGVNRRNLETLQMEPEVLTRLLPMIPGHCVAISESGIGTRRDVEEVAALGADAVLIGSSLSVSKDPRAVLAELTTVERMPRG